MPSVFLISDTHFGHNNACKFTYDNGEKLRPWDNANDMDEALVENWNSVVKPKDKVYHLGDVAIPKRGLQVMGRLNGDKVLIKGNHDIYKLADYTEFFRDIRAYHVMDRMILSHIPIHNESQGRFRANIHGHLHGLRVKKNNEIDPFYYCVAVENIGFTPILFEKVRQEVDKQQGTWYNI